MSAVKNTDNFIKRAAVAVCLAWLILCVHSIALRRVSQMIEMLPPVLIGSGICALIGGVISAAFVRGRPIVLTVVAVLLGAGVMGVLTRVF